MKKILVTGGLGFIGSHTVVELQNVGFEVIIIDDLSNSSINVLENIHAITGIKPAFHQIDLRVKKEVQDFFKNNSIDGIIHFAAESHVDNSIKNPDAFIRTNVFGTFTLLNTAKNHWMNGPNSIKPKFKDAKFLHVSTDEVYGTLGETGLFTEETPYAPNSPYSASKASSDFMVRSYFHTYGMNVVTTNCSNNYGPKQHDEKLIPTIIRKAISGENIPIYGDGKNIRDWLYVLDHCTGIELVFNNGKLGETYNVGGENERNNLYIANKICEILDEIHPVETSYKEQISFVKDRPGHDFRYAIDAAKLESELGWKADENFESGILKTVEWYLKKYQN